MKAFFPGLSHFKKSTRYFLALCLITIAGCGGEWVEEEVDMGYQGEARFNPLLAAQQMCDELELPSQSLPGFPGWSPDSDVYSIVMPAETFVEGHVNIDSVIQFLDDGGNLVIYFSGVLDHIDVDGFQIDLSPFNPKGAQHGLKELMDRCGVEMVVDDTSNQWSFIEPGRQIHQFKLDGEKRIYDIYLTDAIQFKLKKNARRESHIQMVTKKKNQKQNNGNKNLLARNPLGSQYQAQPILSTSVRSGRVTFVSDGKWMTQMPRNTVSKQSTPKPMLGQHSHAALLWEMVNPTDYWHVDQVQFIYGIEKGFMWLLWKHGWMAIVPLFIWLVLWLWQGLSRFGTIQEAESDNSRDFREHIKATGKYWWRHQCQVDLVHKQREHVFSLIRKRWPHAAHLLLDGGQIKDPQSRMARDSVVQGLMQMTRLEAKELKLILMDPVHSDPDSFVHIVNRLKHIEESI